jgi:hypothetical protein
MLRKEEGWINCRKVWISPAHDLETTTQRPILKVFDKLIMHSGSTRDSTFYESMVSLRLS